MKEKNILKKILLDFWEIYAIKKIFKKKIRIKVGEKNIGDIKIKILYEKS